MYPSEELRFLAASKEALREQIFVRREICAVAAARVARPIAWLDRVQARWHNLSPLVKMAALPAGLLLKRLILPRTHILGKILRWGPIIYGAVRGLTAARQMSHRS
jgi:hypothetical protein